MSTSDNRETSVTSTASQTSPTIKIELSYKITVLSTRHQNKTVSVDSVVLCPLEDVDDDCETASSISGELFEDITKHKSLVTQYTINRMTLRPKVGKETSVFDNMPGSFQDRCRDRWQGEESFAVAKAEVSDLEVSRTIDYNPEERLGWEIKGSAVWEIQDRGKFPHTASAWQLL